MFCSELYKHSLSTAMSGSIFILRPQETNLNCKKLAYESASLIATASKFMVQEIVCYAESS